jgi:hypothetical protein
MADKADDIRNQIIKGRQDIVDNRAAITEKLANLEDRVEKTVDGVKHAFDFKYQVKQRPWLMFGGSMLVGYTLAGRRETSNISESLSHVASQPNLVSEVRTHIEDDLATIKGAVFGAVISTLWAMAKQVLLEPARKIDGVVITPTAQPFDSRHFTQRVITSKTNGRHEP